MLIFGREPAAVIAAVGSILTFLAAVAVPGIDAGAAAAITGFVAAVIMAITTRPVAPAVLTAIITAGVALAAEYGLDVPDAAVGTASGVVLAVFALLTRGQVSPKEAPALRR